MSAVSEFFSAWLRRALCCIVVCSSVSLPSTILAQVGTPGATLSDGWLPQVTPGMGQPGIGQTGMPLEMPFLTDQQPVYLTPTQMVPARSQGHGVLPGGLLYRSYIAGPHEPRLASVLLYDASSKQWRWDSTLGGRVGLYRQGYSTFLNFDAWQIDVEGAVMSRLDPEQQMDVESNDFRFGLLWTGRRDNVAVKFGYFHISSHLGDEYLLRNPGVERINFVRESVILGSSLQATPEFRLYGEVAWAFAARSGALPLQFQFGSEFSAIAPFPEHGAPFTAVNVQLREETDYAAGLNIMTGWQWKGLTSERTLRVGMQYFNGPSNQYSFFQRYDNQLGLGIWIDF